MVDTRLRAVVVGAWLAGCISGTWAAGPWDLSLPPAVTANRTVSADDGSVRVEFQLGGRVVGARTLKPGGVQVTGELFNFYPGTERIGVFLVYDPAGWLKQAMTLNRAFNKHGVQTEWDAAGKLVSERFYVAGQELPDRGVYERRRATDDTLIPAAVFHGLPGLRSGRPLPAASPVAARVNAVLGEADQLFVKPRPSAPSGTLSPQNLWADAMQRVDAAGQVAATAPEVEERTRLTLQVAARHTQYGGRLFDYFSKGQFITHAGDLLRQAEAMVGQVGDRARRGALYYELATGWRELAKIALWGSHPLNKLACDEMTRRFYERATQADAANTQYQQTWQQVNTPRPPVPAVPAEVAGTPPIPEPVWAVAAHSHSMVFRGEEYIRPAGPGPQHSGGGESATYTVEAGTCALGRGGGEWQTVTGAHQLRYNDSVRTEAGSRSHITYDNDAARFEVQPEAEVVFQGSQLVVRKGSVLLEVTKRGSQFLVITPTLVTGCRGTLFQVTVGAQGATAVHVFRGVVEVRNGGAPGYLVAGKSCVSPALAAGLEVTDFDAAARLAQLRAPAPAGALPGADGLLFETGFDGGTLAAMKLERRTAYGKNSGFAGAPEYQANAGPSVNLTGGALTISQDERDRGGAVVTPLLQPVPGKVLVIIKRTRLHYANNHFTGCTALLLEDEGGGNSRALGGVYYYHYENRDHFWVGQETNRLAPVWDNWFDEVIVYDPATGELALAVNGGNPVTAQQQPTKLPFRVGFAAYGWDTGHRHEIDELRVLWLDPNDLGQ